MNLTIRESIHSEFPLIKIILTKAFGSEIEAELVESLFDDKTAEPVLSLIASSESNLVGHILFTRVRVGALPKEPLAFILAPMAVLPGTQRQGVGGELIKCGLEKLKELGTDLVFVLGHIDYYPRFGFIPNAALAGFPPPHPLQEEHADAWMVRPFTPGAIDSFAGPVACCTELNRPEYWVE